MKENISVVLSNLQWLNGRFGGLRKDDRIVCLSLPDRIPHRRIFAPFPGIRKMFKRIILNMTLRKNLASTKTPGIFTTRYSDIVRLQGSER